MRAAGIAIALDWDCGKKAAQRLKDAGFVDVEVKTYRWPFGGQWEEEQAWGDIGEYVAAEVGNLNYHMVGRLMGKVGAGEDEIRGLQEEAVEHLKAEEGKHWVY